MYIYAYANAVTGEQLLVSVIFLSPCCSVAMIVYGGCKNRELKLKRKHKITTII